MRDKELRLALVCYGGVSLAVYMHGITKEIWRLAKASQSVHSSAGKAPSNGVYDILLRSVCREAGIELRVLVDILAGASAGGINAVFLGHAIASGATLDPLTELWLDGADVDALLDLGGGPIAPVAKFARAGRLGAHHRIAISKDASPATAPRSRQAPRRASARFAPPFSPMRSPI